jgi:hypothetical protein
MTTSWSARRWAPSAKLVGTALGALGGALLGSAVSPHHGGALIGGIGGAVVGNQLSRGKCIRRSSASYRRTEPATYAQAGAGDRCHYENRPFYNERGELIYQPTRVCGR